MLLDKLMGTKIESAVITKICPGYSLDDQVKMSKACSIYVIVNANMTITSSVYELWRREPNQRRGTSSPVSSGHGRVPLPVGPSVVTVPAVDQYWTPCSSSPGYVNSQTHVVIKFWDISWQRRKGVPRLVSAGVCALKPMIVTFYDIILLSEPCFQSFGGIPKPINR